MRNGLVSTGRNIRYFVAGLVVMIATEEALPVGEFAASISENGYAALVALKSSRRTVFWCDGEASQPESLCACLKLNFSH
jgi:hypothetical protein